MPFNKKLYRFNILCTVNWESQVYVNDIAKRRAIIIKHPYTDANII